MLARQCNLLLQIANEPDRGGGRARVGVDVGGTFTDVILHEADGRVRVHKLLSTPPTYDRAVVEAVSGLAGNGRASARRARSSTARPWRRTPSCERLGAETALVTTRNFRDVLELRRLRIPHMYDLFWRKPPPLVERRLRFEVVGADGRRRDGRRAAGRGARSATLAARLRELGIDSVAVCFLHSYLYPEHEQRVGRDPGGGAARRDDLALERDPARAARVRALARRPSSTPTSGR